MGKFFFGNTSWDTFRDFLQDSFRIFKAFSWYSFLEKEEERRILTGIFFSRFKQFYQGFFLEKKKEFLNSDRHRGVFPRVSYRTSEIFPVLLPESFLAFSRSSSPVFSKQIIMGFHLGFIMEISGLQRMYLRCCRRISPRFSPAGFLLMILQEFLLELFL